MPEKVFRQPGPPHKPGNHIVRCALVVTMRRKLQGLRRMGDPTDRERLFQ
jgi:hypothetical protein